MASLTVVDTPLSAGRPNGALVSPDSELGRALRRVQELESELQRLREGASSSTGSNGSSNGSSGSSAHPITDMRLLDVEGLLVRQAMERHRGNVSRAARALGLSRSALYRRLDRHKID